MLGHMHVLVGFCTMTDFIFFSDCFFDIHVYVTGNQQDEEGHSGESTRVKSTSNSLHSVDSDNDITETGSKKGSDKMKRGEELQQPVQGYLIRIFWCSFMPLVIKWYRSVY